MDLDFSEVGRHDLISGDIAREKSVNENAITLKLEPETKYGLFVKAKNAPFWSI